jgi:hypothetical protein
MSWGSLILIKNSVICESAHLRSLAQLSPHAQIDGAGERIMRRRRLCIVSGLSNVTTPGRSWTASPFTSRIEWRILHGVLKGRHGIGAILWRPFLFSAGNRHGLQRNNANPWLRSGAADFVFQFCGLGMQPSDFRY